MKRATESHKPLIVDILSQSFDDNRSVNYVVKSDANRRQRIKGLMNYSFDICNAFGDVWISDDLKTCALVLLPDKKKFSIASTIWDLKLALSVIGLSRLASVLRRESKIKAYHPKDAFAYLWFIGVELHSQNKGLGTKLLKEIIQKYQSMNRPIYLETSVDRNLPWYLKHGFEIFETIDLTYKLTFLRRNVV